MSPSNITTALAERMKAHELPTRLVLPRRTYTLIRVDGRAFHTLLRHADRPFDTRVQAAMNGVAEVLCAEIDGAVLAYTQSDEVSVLAADFTASGTQPWFGGVVQKMASISAATATVAFNRTYGTDHGTGPATFDARVFTIPSALEAADYFRWRQRDAIRNSIHMAARAHFSHRRLHGLNLGQLQELLRDDKGVNWNDYPPGFQRGRVTTRQTGDREVSYTDRRTGQQVTATATRSWWATTAAPHFTTDPGGFLARTIPPLPALPHGAGNEPLEAAQTTTGKEHTS